MQTVTIKSAKSKAEVISALKANSEVWHKDGSTIPLEGKMDDNGNFDFKLAHNEKIYRQETAGLTFIGQISEDNGTTTIQIKIKVMPALLIFAILLLSFGIAISVYMFITSPAVGVKRFPGFIPFIIVIIFYAIKYYHTYTRVKNKTLGAIKIFVS